MRSNPLRSLYVRNNSAFWNTNAFSVRARSIVVVRSYTTGKWAGCSERVVSINEQVWARPPSPRCKA